LCVFFPANHVLLELCFRLVATFYWHLHPMLRWQVCALGSLLHSTSIYTQCWEWRSGKLMCSVAHSLLWYSTSLWIKSQSFHINCHWEMGSLKGDVQMVSPDQMYGVFCNYLTTLNNNATCPPHALLSNHLVLKDIVF
jgi:hypothetical protein